MGTSDTDEREAWIAVALTVEALRRPNSRESWNRKIEAQRASYGAKPATRRPYEPSDAFGRFEECRAVVDDEELTEEEAACYSMGLW